MRYRTAVALAAATTATLTMTACGSSTADTPPPSASASVAVAAGSTADISFAQLMIAHHEQAVEMADLALAKSNSPQVKQLATSIKTAQAPEIAQMQGWLAQWGAPSQMASASSSASDGMDGMDMGGMDHGGVAQEGMMTPAAMNALGKASGTAFNRMWLQMMIAHHEGAIQMAEGVKANSQNPEVIALANNIITTQQAEINTMESLLPRYAG